MCKACHGCIRIMMMIFNFIFVLCGLGLFAGGLYFYLGTFFREMGDDGWSMVITLYVIMGLGAFTLIVGACGCCGAYHESPGLLGTYFVLLLLVFAAEVAGGVLCFIYQEKVLGLFDKAFEQGVNELAERQGNQKHWMDDAQTMLSCCGNNGPRDYAMKGKTTLPKSCCDSGPCSLVDINDPGKIIRSGCQKAWETFVKDKWMIFAGVLIGIALIELLGLIFSMCLCCTARRIEYDMVETRA